MLTLISDIDGTLTGNEFGIRKFNEFIKGIRDQIFLIYATGRNYNDYNKVMIQEGIILPDAFILNVGADIYIKKQGAFIQDFNWYKEIDDGLWNGDKIKNILQNINGLKPQEYFHKYKISFYVDEFEAENIIKNVALTLKSNNIKAKIIFSHNIFLDILPEKCDKAKAAKYVLKLFKLSEDLTVVAGDSENDIDLFWEFKNGIIVSNATQTFLNTIQNKGFYIASSSYAEGVLEGLKYYINKLKID